jgi:pyridoxamine 5'-phosphate oxidase
MNDIAAIRKEYKLRSLDEHEVDADPFTQFRLWWTEAIDSKIEEVNAMTLATANEKGRPSARIVLLKGFDDNGFVFFTNYQSHKAADLEKNPQASLVFFWKELERQVRIEGTAEKIAAAENDAYFQSRPLGSRIGAWASPQSEVIESREIIEKKVAAIEKELSGSAISCPPFWGGYVLRPALVEFWQGRPNRLHDRVRYMRNGTDSWKIERLAP